MARMMSDTIVRMLSILAVLALWQAIAMSGSISSFLLPSATTVAARVWQDVLSGALLANAVQTMYRSLTGFLIACIFGTTIGLLMRDQKLVRWFFDPLISIGFPTPKIALLPIFILWFGLGDQSKIALIAVACFFTIAVNSYAGATNVERQFIWSAEMLGASRLAVLKDVVLPAALPQIVTGMQIAIPVSLIVAIVTEMLMGGGGLGGQLLKASRYANSPVVFASIVEIALVGAIVVKATAWLRRRLLHWHQEAKD